MLEKLNVNCSQLSINYRLYPLGLSTKYSIAICALYLYLWYSVYLNQIAHTSPPTAYMPLLYFMYCIMTTKFSNTIMLLSCSSCESWHEGMSSGRPVREVLAGREGDVACVLCVTPAQHTPFHATVSIQSPYYVTCI